jgi:hypothetical protein
MGRPRKSNTPMTNSLQPVTPQGKNIANLLEKDSVSLTRSQALTIFKEVENPVIATSRKGPLGQIVVRRKGLAPSRAATVVKKFVDNIGGKEDLAEKLEAVGEELNATQKKLLDLLHDPLRTRHSLSRLIAESGTEPVSIMKLYARGAIELGRVEAAIEAHKGLPALIRNLYKHAFEGLGICDVCAGIGKTKVQAGQGSKEGPICWKCQGSGKMETTSPHKEFAVQKLLEVTKSVGKDGTNINIQTNVGVKIGGEGILEKVIKASDEVLWGKSDVVDAEVKNISSEGGGSVPSQDRSE